jgi:hypothetical protein
MQQKTGAEKHTQCNHSSSSFQLIITMEYGYQDKELHAALSGLFVKGCKYTGITCRLTRFSNASDILNAVTMHAPNLSYANKMPWWRAVMCLNQTPVKHNLKRSPTPPM